jgi:hypothetical protein
VRIISVTFVDAGMRAVGTSGGGKENALVQSDPVAKLETGWGDSRTRVNGRIEDALDKWEIAVTDKVDRVKGQRAEMAVDLFVDSLDDGILLFGVCQCEVVGGAGAVKEVLDMVVSG